MKILQGMLPDYWEGCIPPWICTCGYEEVRNYRKTLLIQSIVESGWWGGCIPHIPPCIPVWGMHASPSVGCIPVWGMHPPHPPLPCMKNKINNHHKISAQSDNILFITPKKKNVLGFAVFAINMITSMSKSPVTVITIMPSVSKIK